MHVIYTMLSIRRSISKDERPTDKGFLTRRMISDVDIIEDETTPSSEQPYTGEYDIVSKLRGKIYSSSQKQEKEYIIGVVQGGT